jgi:universal stress protein E
MRPIRRILVAIKDPRARSSRAVKKAVQLAHALGARLELFHAIDTPIFADLIAGNRARQFQSQWSRQQQQRLERAAAPVRREGLKVTTAVEWDYPIYESIVRRAARIGADLIVAERHGGRHLFPSLLQLTDWELLRLSPVPVLLVKTSRPYRRPVVLAAVDPLHAFAKPAGLDNEILLLGAALSRALRGKLHAVHACAPPMPLGTLPSADAGYAETQVDRARTAFDQALRSSGIPRARRHFVNRTPVDAIQNVARRAHTAIVVTGAISRSGLKRVFIGNTAEQLLDRLPCDLLIVKPRRFVNRVPRARRGVRVVAPIL